MRLLFDSHFLVGIANDVFTASQSRMLESVSSAELRMVSVASLWEIAIKCRLGKLTIDKSLAKFPETLEAYGFVILEIDRRHVMEELHNPPRTKDPFDRLLLAQCQVEGLRLVTADRALIDHPLAWRAP